MGVTMRAQSRVDWPAWLGQWRRLRNALLDMLYPPRCVSCGLSGPWWCSACTAQVQVIDRAVCPRCGRPQAGSVVCPQCRHSPLEIDGIRSAVMFQGPLREAIHHLKYNGRISLAEPLGKFLIECWRASDLPAEVIVPVPLHEARLRERGYNQSALLARELARASGLPIMEDAVRRVKATVPQVTLNAVERRANVHEAFLARADLVRGRRVLLVDDVCTTGATLEACSRALGQAGAASVWALTLGRAP
jgi:ComF family protein